MTSFPHPAFALVPTELLQWFDDAPFRYWSIAWIAWILLGGITALRVAADWNACGAKLRQGPAWLLHPLTFVAAALLAIVAFRWPMLFAGPLMNPDETQLGAGAITYWRDPVPWRSVDLHTSGPLNAYFLWPALLFDGCVDYAGMRLAALFAHATAALASYGFLRRFASEGIARLAALPVITFVAFCSSWDFVQYSSEQLSVLLLAVSAWLIAVACTGAWTRERPARWRLGVAGFVLGALPFAKMQAVPFGFMLGIFGVVAVWLTTAGHDRTRRTRLICLIGGALIPALVMSLVLTVYGLWAQFNAAYLESNRTYLSGYDEARAQLLRGFVESFITYSEAFSPFFWGMLIVAFAAALGAGLIRLQPRAVLAGAWISLVVGVATVIYPGRAFAHYLHFLLLPLAWLGGLSVIAALRAAEISSRVNPRRLCYVIVSAFALIALVPQIVRRARESHPAVGSLVAARAQSMHPVSARLRELAQPGDTMMVWGWFPRLYTETGIPQGTREANNYREIEAITMRTFFRDRTLRDLRRNQPALLIDAVCEGSFNYVDRATAGLQIFPELADYVAKNYRLHEELNGYRIYLRNDRD